LFRLAVLGAGALSVASHACVDGNPANGGSSTTSAVSLGGGGGSGGVAGASGTSLAGGGSPDGGPSIRCTRDNGSDPVGLCTQKLVLGAEDQVAFDPTRGLAQSWDATTEKPDVDAMNKVLHDPRDDAAFGAAVARYAAAANLYGDNEITAQLQGDVVALQPTLVAELTPPPAGYAGQLYFDLRATASGLRLVDRNDLADPVDAIADAYGRAIYDVSYVMLAGGDGGATDAVLGVPAAGGATAYVAPDAATGALALADMAVRFATSEPAHATAWQAAAAQVLAHLDARARDPGTGLYFASLVTSADPAHDALGPADPAGPPADALLTDVAARVALALLRAQDLANNNASALPALVPAPFAARAASLLIALDATPQSLWDPAGQVSDGDGGTLGGGYFAGWVPSTSQLLTDKPIRANALLLAALDRAPLPGTGSDAPRVRSLRALLVDRLGAPLPSEAVQSNETFMSVVANQNGYFRSVPSNFDFTGVDAGADPRARSYFGSANAAVIEGLNELLLGVSN
jgi:hypothetical protein